ncbi:Hypothetical predicted protein [Olea europaea subsp. europaea]|uniref:Uncharacterized protein n=1 Tax=Olea europaea subsp. europaea TaxID=158383 RepID=A0A8S0SFY8_OLEEU|nr:Hypothetical predicted protein [Olea europaea subsp. europaea]
MDKINLIRPNKYRSMSRQTSTWRKLHQSHSNKCCSKSGATNGGSLDETGVGAVGWWLISRGSGGGCARGDGVGLVTGAGDGDGVAVGGATEGAGVGVAVGETFGAPAGACAMHTVAKSAIRTVTLNPIDDPIVAGER